MHFPRSSVSPRIYDTASRTQALREVARIVESRSLPVYLALPGVVHSLGFCQMNRPARD